MEYTIYKIICNDLNVKDCYVGSSMNFKQRRLRHKNNCTNATNEKYHLKVYQFIRCNGGWNNWSIVEIEKCICKNKYEAYVKERYWIETLKAILNTRIPLRTKNELQYIKKKYYQKKIFLNKQKIIQLEINKLALELAELEIDFLSKL